MICCLFIFWMGIRWELLCISVRVCVIRCLWSVVVLLVFILVMILVVVIGLKFFNFSWYFVCSICFILWLILVFEKWLLWIYFLIFVFVLVRFFGSNSILLFVSRVVVFILLFLKCLVMFFIFRLLVKVRLWKFNLVWRILLIIVGEREVGKFFWFFSVGICRWVIIIFLIFWLIKVWNGYNLMLFRWWKLWGMIGKL